MQSSLCCRRHYDVSSPPDLPGDAVAHITYAGEHITVVESVDVSSSYDFTQFWISDRMGWPIATLFNHGGDANPTGCERYSDLKIDPPIPDSMFATPKRGKP